MPAALSGFFLASDGYPFTLADWTDNFASSRLLSRDCTLWGIEWACLRRHDRPRQNGEFQNLGGVETAMALRAFRSRRARRRSVIGDSLPVQGASPAGEICPVSRNSPGNG